MTASGKICTKCGVCKSFGEYHKSGKNKSGFASACKECENERGKLKYKKTKEKVLKRQSAHRAAHPERHRTKNKQWYEANKVRKLALAAEWRRANPEKCREYTRKFERANPEKGRERNRRRMQKPRSKIENAIRAGINKGIRSKDKRGNRTFDILGYSVTELMDHLQRQFTKGMSWDNYGHGHGCWHIEHEIPVVAHNYETPYDIDFERCWSLKNLRPMWAEENWAKNDKLDKPFQPSLAMELPKPANDNVPDKAIAV